MKQMMKLMIRDCFIFNLRQPRFFFILLKYMELKKLSLGHDLTKNILCQQSQESVLIY